MKPMRLSQSEYSRQSISPVLNRGRRRRTGSTLLEFALVLPVLIALIIGIMEFGWLVYNNMTIANAAREGARSASLGNLTATVNALVTSRVSPLSVTTTIEHSIDGGATYVTTSNKASANNAPFGALIRVSIRYRFRPLTGFFPFLNNYYIKSKAEFGRE